jgi:Tfp pilus assembly protein PilF
MFSAIYARSTLIVVCAFIGPRVHAAQTITFNKDIAPIVFKHCSGCHRPGEAAPFSLLNYADVRSHAAQIVAAVGDRYMPPWKPEPGYGDFARVRRLGESDIDLIRRWVEQGAVEGRASDRPSPPRWPAGWQLGTPDLVVAMPQPYVLPAAGGDVFRTFVIPIPSSSPRYVKGLEFRVGATKAVHHANIKVDRTRASRRLDEDEDGAGFDGGSNREAAFPDGQFLGWTPGQTPHILEGTAWQLSPNTDLVIEAHMTPTGRAEAIQLSVGLYFSEAAPARTPSMLRLGSQRIDIAPGAAQYESHDSYVLPVDVEVFRVQAHAHNLARTVEGSATLPDGTTRWLINIRNWDFRWQDVYEYSRPVRLPAGTRLTLRYTYDNSTDNPRNPSRPPRRVTFGQTTASEMGDLWLQVVAGNERDRAALERDYAPKMLAEDIAGVEKALETAPGDARLRADLGLCYIEAGRVADALVELEKAVQLDARSASARYDLGTLLLRQERYREARDRFVSAIALKPRLAEAHNNLGVVNFLEGRLDEAIHSYDEALRLQPENGQAHYNLGRALAARDRKTEALAHYRDALRLLPSDGEIHASMGSLLSTLGRVDEAIQQYRLALQANPDLPAALTDLAWILATTERRDLRNADEAIRLAERASELTGHQNALVLDTLAAACFSAGYVDRAVRSAEKALDVASAAHQEELARHIRERLDFYRRKR